MSGLAFEDDAVVVRNVNQAVKWQKGDNAPNQGKTDGRWHNIDGRWRCALMLHDMLDGKDEYSIQRRLDEADDGHVMCKQWLEDPDGSEELNGTRGNWRYYVTALPELIAESAIDPERREEARRQLAQEAQ